MRTISTTVAIALSALATSSGCGLPIGVVPRYADNVEVAAFSEVFGCDAPKTPAAEDACRAIAAFEGGGKVTSYPSTGETIYLSRERCSGKPDEVMMQTIALMPGTPPGDVDELFRAPGVLSQTISSVRVPGEGVDDAAVRIIARLEQGDAPGVEKVGAFPDSWDEWKASRAKREPKPVPTAQSAETSLLEHPSELSTSYAYWREAEGALVRLQPPAGNEQWCVNHYFPLPG